MAQLQAGYIIEGIRELFKNQTNKNKTDGLLKNLSYFELETDTDISVRRKNVEIAAVANNIISRGLPTRPSLYIEETFASIFKKTKKQKGASGNILYGLIENNNDLAQKLFEALHIIDPRINLENQTLDYNRSWDKFGEDFEGVFLYSVVPEYLGEQFIQVFENNRDFVSILKNVKFKTPLLQDFSSIINEKYVKQDADFTVEIPYNIDNEKGIIIEIDGENHEFMTQNELDTQRDDILTKTNWANTLRIKKAEFDKVTDAIKPLQTYLEQEYFDLLTQNYKNALYENSDGIEAMQLALSPVAIARIQKTILEFVIAGKLKFYSKKWNIAVIERDVPCAFLAIEDLKQLLQNLFTLEGSGKKVPEINLSVFTNDEFKDAILNKTHKDNLLSLESFEKDITFDILIDISVLQKKGLFNAENNLKSKFKAVIRSAHAPVSPRNFHCSNPINYKAFLLNEGRQNSETVLPAKDAITYLLQNIFRKRTFLPGQLEFLNKAIQRKSVAAILPSGGGKSLCYQLSVLLQPGIAVVIEPFRSLAIDQSEDLINVGIDCFIYAEPSLKRSEKKTLVNIRIANGEGMFIYFSPDSLKSPLFRNDILEINRSGKYFSYAIIDEAHCISEWGHDFRSGYAEITSSIRKICKTKNNTDLPMIGLTGNVPYNVVSDIRHELKIANRDIVSLPHYRIELKYKIEQTDNPKFLHTPDIQTLKDAIAAKKQNKLNSLITKSFFAENTGTKQNISEIVFCPEKSGALSVTNSNRDGVGDKLKDAFKTLRIGTYLGAQDDYKDAVNLIIAMESEDNQRKFINNELDIIVATKTLGIGIDKPNIRHTCHINMPNSIESFLQSTGRAGHDKKISSGTLLFNNQVFEVHDNFEMFDEKGEKITINRTKEINPDKQILLDEHHILFKGRNRERGIINSLLRQISYPVYYPEKTIIELIEENLGYKVKFDYTPEGYPFHLNITNEKDNFGHIDFRYFEAVTENVSLDPVLCKQILTFVMHEIEKKCPKNRDKIKWLRSEIKQASRKGIERSLSEMKPGESRQLKINFRNNRIGEINRLLRRYVSDKFNEDIVSEAARYCKESSMFINKLCKTANVNIIEGNINIGDKVAALFYQIREKEDTFKALFRLMAINLVNDYFIDYNTKTISFKITKRKKHDYIDALSAYVEKYYSKQRALKIPDIVKNFEGKSYIQKCINFMISFVYNEIEESRQQAIDMMELACQKGVSEENKDLNVFFEFYFSAKYANPEVSPNLLSDTQNFSDFDFEDVKNYIELVGDKRENWFHLRGATDKLLKKYRNNYMLLILNAYAQMLTIEDPELLEKAIENFVNGFEKCKKTEKLSTTGYQAIISLLSEKLYGKTEYPGLKEIIEPYINTKIQTIWLSNFNNKFLEEYER
jgi:ATP-dependent DNA helicase RecQ